MFQSDSVVQVLVLVVVVVLFRSERLLVRLLDQSSMDGPRRSMDMCQALEMLRKRS